MHRKPTHECQYGILAVLSRVKITDWVFFFVLPQPLPPDYIFSWSLSFLLAISAFVGSTGVVSHMTEVSLVLNMQIISRCEAKKVNC